MAPRKKAKPNPAVAEEAPPSSPTMQQQSSSSASSQRRVPSISANKGPTASLSPITIPASRDQSPRGLKPNGSGDRTPPSGSGSKQVNKTKSWYGSLPRKAVASTAAVARETILGGTSKPKATADFSRFDLENSKKTPDATSMDGQHDETRVSETTKPEAPKPEATDTQAATDGQTKAPEPTEVASDGNAQQPADSGVGSTPQRPTSTWLGGWWGKPPNPQASGTQPVTSSETALSQATPSSNAVDSTPAKTNPPEPAKETQPEQATSEVSKAPKGQTTEQNKQRAASGSSWLWSWSGKGAPPQQESEPSPDEPAAGPAEPQTVAKLAEEPGNVVAKDAPPIEATPEPAPKSGSTWAFWSRDNSSSSSKKSTRGQDDQGQLAVMGDSSENQPKRTKSMEFKGTPPKEAPSIASAKKEDSTKSTGKKEDQVKASAAVSRPASLRRTKRDRPDSMEIDETALSRPGTPNKTESAPATAPAAGKSAPPKTPTSAKASAPSLVLPSFKSTYKLKENPSIVKQITRLLLRGQQTPSKHVYLTKETPKIKKAIAIGVHGLFPANYLRPMIGQPTGTSIKFANHSAEAIRRWADSHGCQDCEIEKVALEGEGKIGERVENLWKLLLNWIDQIRSADLILIGCHSQGVPVSIMLLAKLIEMGVVTGAKVGVCAMAGVSLGPFPDYTRSSMGYLMGSAAELWAFADPQSEVSQRLEASVKAVLAYGARITYIGSIDDQLVPLESAIYAPAHHPYIFRAAFIDGRIHAPDFIAHLVGFALKLRNLGVSDHGLIKELSTPLAGSLYSGEGHSRLYDDPQVYDLALMHALETTDVVAAQECEVKRTGVAGATTPNNPYLLPWIMRGLLEEDFVKTDLSDETAELVRQFDDWKPVTKALKDVKYRLEAVRSKL
ncbi:hypothetical protein QBC42DRAFT_350993 [Cladorrhinum samala]|uniref:YMC020W-like alpha/beta hydrolase domain-containing protein n=1 Tax=Cladorrhinum samala TaxID=585594 RepID=A0AAV9H6X1_9PEZI|nr:hypothetical protein QBC42DRAFT_350993 [Cladorrhinum samala]